MMRNSLPISKKETRQILFDFDPPITEEEVDWELRKYKQAKNRSGKIIPQNARTVCRLALFVRKRRRAARHLREWLKEL